MLHSQALHWPPSTGIDLARALKRCVSGPWQLGFAGWGALLGQSVQGSEIGRRCTSKLL